MSDEKKLINNDNQFPADPDFFRTDGEKLGLKSNPEDKQAFEDLRQISKLFSDAKPGASEIPESVDNLVLEHIKQKSREIRRKRKVVHLFPSYKWVTAAAMGILVCAVSFKLVYKMDKPANHSFKDNVTPLSAGLSDEIDERGTIIADNKQPVKKVPAGGNSIQRKSGLRMVSTEMRVNKIPEENLKSVSEQNVKDIDGNGRINIIDAYLMDRRLMSGTTMPEKLDLNGDGNINSEDLNNIVKTAVSVGRGEV